MINTVFGALTIVDLNTTSPKVFWKGELLNNIKSVVASSRAMHAHMTIHVVNPSKIVPALDQAEIARLDLLYDQMQSSGIKIVRGPNGA